MRSKTEPGNATYYGALFLPWGSAAYHSERIDESICSVPSYATSQGSATTGGVIPNA